MIVFQQIKNDNKKPKIKLAKIVIKFLSTAINNLLLFAFIFFNLLYNFIIE